jgi:hypothetical protein
MTTFRVARQKPDPRRKGRCPKCFAIQGELCVAMRGERAVGSRVKRPRGGVHRERLTLNGIDPATVFGKNTKTSGQRRRQRKSPNET